MYVRKESQQFPIYSLWKNFFFFLLFLLTKQINVIYGEYSFCQIFLCVVFFWIIDLKLLINSDWLFVICTVTQIIYQWFTKNWSQPLTLSYTNRKLSYASIQFVVFLTWSLNQTNGKVWGKSFFFSIEKVLPWVMRIRM